MESTERTLLVLAGIVILAIFPQWLAWRIKAPAVLLLLTVGCLVGPVTGLLNPQALFGQLLLPVVSLAVGLILFEGGLDLRFRELRGPWRTLAGLLTVGVLVSWIGTTIAGRYILDLPWPISLVLGAVLVVTGPTVIGPLLRDIRPAGRVAAIAKWEGIVIDPLGATLAVLVFETTDVLKSAQFGTAVGIAAWELAGVAATGLVVGLGAAVLLIVMLKRFWLPDYLQNPVSLALVIAAFATADLIHQEAGLLAATVMGIALANQRRVSVHRIAEFQESLTVLLISLLFIVLTARMPAAGLLALSWRGPAFAAALILVIRPLVVWISTIGSGLTKSERIFLAWFAPRGIVAAAVSSVFALRLGPAGAGLAPATFIVIFTTVAVYGLTAGWVAKRLGLSIANPQGLLLAGANKTARAIAEALQQAGFDVTLVDTSSGRVRKAKDAGLRACFANVLSEEVLEDLDLGRLGRFLALTSNDEINTLAVARFRDFFGRQNVFQLPIAEAGISRLEGEWKTRLAGRTLFDKALTYDFLDTALYEGAQIKITSLTEVFTYDEFRKHYGERAWPLFLIDSQHRLQVWAADLQSPVPKPCQSLVSLVLPEGAGASLATAEAISVATA